VRYWLRGQDEDYDRAVLYNAPEYTPAPADRAERVAMLVLVAPLWIAGVAAILQLASNLLFWSR
jgi:hypothetical protein